MKPIAPPSDAELAILAHMCGDPSVVQLYPALAKRNDRDWRGLLLRLEDRGAVVFSHRDGWVPTEAGRDLVKRGNE